MRHTEARARRECCMRHTEAIVLCAAQWGETEARVLCAAHWGESVVCGTLRRECCVRLTEAIVLCAAQWGETEARVLCAAHWGESEARVRLLCFQQYSSLHSLLLFVFYAQVAVVAVFSSSNLQVLSYCIEAVLVISEDTSVYMVKEGLANIVR